jgi:hypothetical protein
VTWGRMDEALWFRDGWNRLVNSLVRKGEGGEQENGRLNAGVD